MKSYLVKISVSCFMFFITVSGFSQKDFQGIVYYESKTTVDMSGFGGEGLSDERRKQMVDRMKSALEKTYVLTFNQSESIYKEEEKKTEPSRGGGFRISIMGGGAAVNGPQYKSVKNKLLLQEQDFFGKQFLIKDSLQKLNWKMQGETKQIGDYMCFKATATKTIDVQNVPSFRRSSDEDETDDETSKEVEVVAWYTMQIPINQGPDDYWGLPGLILEINADKTTIMCSKIILNPAEKEVITKPSKGKEISKKEYDAIVNKKMEEMRNSYRNNGGSGGRRR